MSRVLFDDQRPDAPVDPNRADIACFVGLVRRTGMVVPADVRAYLHDAGLLRFPFVPADDRPVPAVPANVRSWLALQSWLQGLSSRPAPPAAPAALAAAVAATDTQMALAAPLGGNWPAFVRIDGEIVAVTALDTSRTMLTVQRGIAGSAAAAHAAAAAVRDVTRDALELLAAQLASSIPPAVQKWLAAQGWLVGPFARELDQLADVPVPVESFAGFTAMFDAGGSASSEGTDYVAAAVRSFFAQGGKRCYVVRMGDPVGRTDGVPVKQTKLQSLLIPTEYTAGDPATWHGVGHLAGLPDVSYVAVPDLPVLSASKPAGVTGQTPEVVAEPEQFVVCSQQDVTPQQQRVFPAPAPRLSPSDYQGWAASVAAILRYLVSGTLRQELHLREMQLVAAFPLPQALGPAAAVENSSAALVQDIRDVLRVVMPERTQPLGAIAGTNVSSAFLQLAFPWLKTTGSAVLLESLEPPDGALAGLLARNALKRGAFTSATKITPAEIFDLWPALPARETVVSATPLMWDDVSQKALIERLSLFGFTPSGVRLLSDVTAYPGESYRTACVNRLVAVISRAARNLGTALIFESNGPALWGRIQGALQRLLTTLWSLNAFNGATAAQAFTVRCDRSTMTQNDLDNGRLVAEVTFKAAATIELIRVTLALATDRASTQSAAGVLAEAG